MKKQILDAVLKQSVAYRGYTIKMNSDFVEWNISRDGFHVGYAKSVDNAKAIIDELMGGSK